MEKKSVVISPTTSSPRLRERRPVHLPPRGKGAGWKECVVQLGGGDLVVWLALAWDLGPRGAERGSRALRKKRGFPRVHGKGEWMSEFFLEKI